MDSWIIRNYEYKPCRIPRQEFSLLVSLHNHSNHSFENLSPLNAVVGLTFMKPFRKLLQRAFGLQNVQNLDYSHICYNPPLSPDDVLALELKGARQLGFDRVALAISDHDEIAGSLELRDAYPAEGDILPLGEELSLSFHDHIFHLGVTGIAEKNALETHNQLQALSRQNRLDDLFEYLHQLGCLVVLNHPLIPKGGIGNADVPAMDLLQRFGWAIDALEYNGMRRREENDRVLELAQLVRKPLVGGGDSHCLAPSPVVCGAESAKNFSEYIDEVKSGRGVPLVAPAYMIPVGWKIFLRVLNFIVHYRCIAYYRKEPIRQVITDKMIILDLVGVMARLFLKLAAGMGMIK